MLLPLVSALLLASPHPAAQDSTTRCARVGPDGGAVRAFFDADSPEVAALTAGTPLRVAEIREPWARVEVPGGLDVWVHGDYLKWNGADGELARDHVNARPLPSTDERSRPLGRFAAGDAVVRVGSEGEWFRVRAPERIGGWIPLAQIALLDAPPADWDEIWRTASAARAPLREEPPAPEPPAPEPSGEHQPETGKDSPPAATDGAREASAPRPRAFPPAQVARDPARWLGLAHQDLGALRAELAAGFEGWDGARAQELETAFATVLWHGALAADLESARHGLASLDALRRSYGAWLAAGERRARAAGDELAAADWSARLDALAAGWGSDGDGGGLIAGWVEPRTGPDRELPWAIARNGQSVVAQDFDGRWRLADFAGREVVARGAWRADPRAPGGRLLAVSEIRLLPPAPVR